MATERSELAAGTLVAGYRITQRIGSGGMGTVYAAEEPTIGKRVAIKVLKRELCHDEDAVRRFEREARTANEVRHPGIVDIFGFGTLEGGRPYLVMSLLEGRSLGEELSASGPLPLDVAWGYAREIATALAAAHHAGVVHRDLKPENVFLETFPDRTPRVRLLDLGLAKLVQASTDPDAPDAPAMKLTKTGVPIGTPIYMAPEQWWAGEIDTRVDQYALGVTLFEMLTGAPPFRSEQFVELAQLHLHASPPSLAERGCDTSPDVETFVRRLLAKSPDDRFADMSELIAAGDAAFEGRKQAAATAPTLALASTALSAGSPVRAVRPIATILALFVLGPAALIALGYPGHRAIEWWKTTGPPLFFILAGYSGGLAALVWLAARPSVRFASAAAWASAVFTAVAAALGTHVGWTKVDGAVARLDAPKRFEIIHRGMLELLLSHFIGFFAAAMLFTAIGALAGSPHPAATRDETRRHDLVALGALSLTAVLAVWSGAPSGAVAALIAIAALASPRLANRHRALTLEAAATRATATFLAGAAGLAVALARIDALEANAWNDQPTRAARATAMIAVASERSATLVFGMIILAIVMASGVLRLRRELKGAAVRDAPRRIVGLVALVVLLVGADLALRLQFSSARTKLHEAVESQFVLFANLEPPAAGGLDPETYAPRAAPALQIARNSVAVNGRPLAPLGAVDFEEGIADISREIARALAVRAVEGHDDARLAVSIDHEVKWATATRLLNLARRAGAARVELLFTRGPALALPRDAPPEARWVLASDFVAVPVELGDAGVTGSADAAYEDVAAAILDRARQGEAPVRVALPDITR